MQFQSPRFPRQPSRAAVGPPLRESRSPTPTIGLFGLFGIGNYGNDASLEAALLFLLTSLPNAEIICIASLPERVTAVFGVQAAPISPGFSYSWLARLSRWLLDIPREVLCVINAIRTLRRVDVVITPGTGMLDDYGLTPRAVYAAFRWFLLARLMGKKVLYTSVGAGPINHPVTRRMMLRMARGATYRSYRDANSRDFMVSLGLTAAKDDPIYPDLVFGLPHPAPLPKPAGTPLKISVGIMTYNGWKTNERNSEAFTAYLHKMRSFVAWLLQQGYEVSLLGGDADDASTVAAIFKGTAATEDRLRVETTTSIHDVMSAYRDADIVVATRYHNIVPALAMNRPTISIGYTRKNQSLMEDLDLGQYCQNIEDLDVDMLIRQLQDLIAAREDVASSLRQRIPGYKARLTEQEQRLLRDVLLPPAITT